MTFTLQKSLKLQIPPKEIETSYCVKFKPHTGVSPKLGGEGIMEKHQALVAPQQIWLLYQSSCIL